ncbi:YfhO family protein [Myroides sp. LJL110]
MNIYKKFLPHLLVLVGFILVSLAYFSPVLSGKVIYQSDIVQYTGMAQEQIDFRIQNASEPYWTNSAFGGMPTYQLGAKYPYNFIKDIDSALRFLPRPADYLFLYFLGFYVLMISLRVSPLRAFIGALAFGFSTYLIIILGVGHNAKAHAIAYMPMVLAGVLMVFNKRYLWGGILACFAGALEISANHFQMTYYLLLLLLIVAVVYSVKYIKEKQYKSLGCMFGILILSGILALGSNATNLMATAEYASFSTRGKSDLTTTNIKNTPGQGSSLSYDYITEYSYGIFESLNLFVPGLTGGANNQALDLESNTAKFVKGLGASDQEALSFVERVPTYWADQPIVAAPAYVGAVVVFLFVLGCFVEKRKIKYIFIAGAVFSLLLSWGKNFSILTDFFIHYFPFYNKFRAVSSIQVLLEMCVPALAVLGLYSYSKSNSSTQYKSLLYTLYIFAGTFIFLFIAKASLSFTGANDNYYAQAYGEIGPGFIRAVIQDRKQMYSDDIWRSLILVAVTSLVLYLQSKNKLKQIVVLVTIGGLMVFDLVLVDKGYVNDSNFVTKSQMTTPFIATPADKTILQDKEVFRVYEMQAGLNSARSSFFHQSINGYHAAKPRRIQELFDYGLLQSNMQVLNMFNVKYVISQDEDQQLVPLLNQDHNGNAWFVTSLDKVDNPDQEFEKLSQINTKTTAVINTNAFKSTTLKDNYVLDSLSQIKLVSYLPNKLVYQTNNANDGLGVFSEMYYPYGWNAYIDGEKADILSVNYVLRALELPKGNHQVEFIFEPQVIKKGSRIALISFIIMVVLSIGSIVLIRKKQNKSGV